VVLPEGSKDISVTTPFAVKQSQEVTKSWLYLFLIYPVWILSLVIISLSLILILIF